MHIINIIIISSLKIPWHYPVTASIEGYLRGKDKGNISKAEELFVSLPAVKCRPLLAIFHCKVEVQEKTKAQLHLPH